MLQYQGKYEEGVHFLIADPMLVGIPALTFLLYHADSLEQGLASDDAIYSRRKLEQSVWEVALSKLNAEVESGAGDQGNYHKFQGPHDLKGDIGNGIKISLCNSIFDTEGCVWKIDKSVPEAAMLHAGDRSTKNILAGKICTVFIDHAERVLWMMGWPCR